MQNFDLQNTQKEAEWRLKVQELELERDKIQAKKDGILKKSKIVLYVCCGLGALAFIMMIVAMTSDSWKVCDKEKFKEGFSKSCFNDACLPNNGFPHPSEKHVKKDIDNECKGQTDGVKIAGKGCNNFGSCNNGKFTEHFCADGDYFNETTMSCKTIDGENSLPDRCLPDPRCKDLAVDTYFTIDKICRGYYYCDAKGYYFSKYCPVAEYMDVSTKKCVKTPPAGCSAKFAITMPDQASKFPRVRKYFTKAAADRPFSACMWFKHEGPIHPVCNSEYVTDHLELNNMCRNGLPLFTFYSATVDSSGNKTVASSNLHIHVAIRGKKVFATFNGDSVNSNGVPSPEFNTDCCMDNKDSESCKKFFTALSEVNLFSTYHDTKVATDQWNHVCVDFVTQLDLSGDTHELNIWLNGVKQKNKHQITVKYPSKPIAAFSDKTSWHVVQLGSSPFSESSDATSIFQGEFKDLYMWDKALSDDEVKAMSSSDSTPTYPSENIVLDWEEFRGVAKSLEGFTHDTELKIITKPPEELQVLPEVRQFMFCVGKGRPHPTIEWYKNGTKLTIPWIENGQFLADSAAGGAGILFMKFNGQIDQSGDYKCVAKSGANTVEATAKVLQMSCPNQKLHARCDVSHNESLWFGDEYTKYGVSISDCVKHCQNLTGCTEFEHEMYWGVCKFYRGGCKAGLYNSKSFTRVFTIKNCCAAGEKSTANCTAILPHDTKRVDCDFEKGIPRPRCLRGRNYYEDIKDPCCTPENPCTQGDGWCMTYGGRSYAPTTKSDECGSGLVCWTEDTWTDITTETLRHCPVGYPYIDSALSEVHIEPQVRCTFCDSPTTADIRYKTKADITSDDFWAGTSTSTLDSEETLFKRSKTCIESTFINSEIIPDSSCSTYQRCGYYSSTAATCPVGTLMDVSTQQCMKNVQGQTPLGCDEPRCTTESTIGTLNANCTLYFKCKKNANGIIRYDEIDCEITQRGTHYNNETGKCEVTRNKYCLGETMYKEWGHWEQCTKASETVTRKKTCTASSKWDCSEYPDKIQETVCQPADGGWISMSNNMVIVGIVFTILSITLSLDPLQKFKVKTKIGAVVLYFLSGICIIVAVATYKGVKLEDCESTYGPGMFSAVIGFVFCLASVGTLIGVLILEKQGNNIVVPVVEKDNLELQWTHGAKIDGF